MPLCLCDCSCDETRGRRNRERQLLCPGLALANLSCGVAGGLPATAALARTALNIRSGATSRLAGIINALATGGIASLLLQFFTHLPLCVVAALLFQVAIGMIEKKHLLHAYHMDKSAFRSTVLVAFLCLLFDPTVALVLGAVLGLLRSAEQLARGYSEVGALHSNSICPKLCLVCVHLFFVGL